MSATREPTFSPDKAMANVASYRYPIASVESDYPVSLDPDLSSNVDPNEWATAWVDESERVVLPESDESDDETSALAMKKREGLVMNSEGPAAADDKSAAAKKCGDSTLQVGMTDGLSKDSNGDDLSEDMLKRDQVSFCRSPAKNADDKDPGPTDESFRIQAEEFPPLVDVKKFLAVIDLNAKPLSDESPGSTPAAKTSADKDAVSTSKENLLPEGAPTESDKLHPNINSSPKKPKRETFTRTQDENHEATTRASGKVSKCHTSEPKKFVSGSQLKNREKKTVEQKRDGEQAANGQHTANRLTPESKKANPSKMKTKRSPNQADVSRNKAAGDYRALASRQSPRRKKQASPGDDELLLSDMMQIPRSGKSQPNKAEARDKRTPTGGHQRGRVEHLKGGIFEDPEGRRYHESRVACRDMRQRSLEPMSSPPGHSTDGSLPFRVDPKTRKARNLKLWKALKKWTFLGKLAATSDLDRYRSNNLDLLYGVVEFTSNLSLAAFEVVVGQSAVDRLDSLVTKGMTTLLDKAAALKESSVHGEASLFISGFCSSWIGRPLMAVTSLGAETAGKALAAANGAYVGLGLGQKRAQGVREQGLLKLFLRGLCFPAWAYVYFWATMLFVLNSTLLHYRDIAAKRTRSRRRNRSHSKILQGHSPSRRTIYSFRACTARAASELEKTDPRHIPEQQGHQDRKTKEGGVSQVRRHQAMTSTPQGIIEFQGTGRKRRSRSEQEGDEKPLHVNGHYDETDCMTIVVRSDVRQVKVTPRQDGGLRAQPSAGARLRTAWGKEREVREAENDEEEIEEEDEDQKDEDEDGVEFEPERSRAAGKENGSHQLRVSFRSELRSPPTPDDGEGGRHSDHECDVDWQQMAEGRRITPVKRRLRGGKMEGSSPTPFRLLGVPPSYHDGAKFEDLSVGNQFLCILRKLPYVSDIVRDPRDPAPLAYVCDVPTLIRDDNTRRLLEIAPTRRDERDLKRKLGELYPDDDDDDDDYDSEQDPDYQPDEPDELDTTDPLEYTEAEAAGVSDEDEDDVIHYGDVTHIINAEVHRDKDRDMRAGSLGKDETDTTESQDYERGNKDSANHWEDLDTEVTLD